MSSIGASSPLALTAQVVDPSAALILSDTVSIVGSSNNSVAGDYANIGTSINDYDLIAVIGGSIGAITQAPLTATADDKTRTAGTPNPSFTTSYAGFVVGEDLGNLGGSLLFSTLATIASPICTYPITPYGRTSSSYASSFSEGLLFVTAFGTLSNPAAVGAATSIYATDEHSIRTSVENGGGLADVLNPQPHPMEWQGSGDILIIECGINVPGKLCNSR